MEDMMGRKSTVQMTRMQVCGNSYMGDVSQTRLLRHGAELPGIICTADSFGLS